MVWLYPLVLAPVLLAGLPALRVPFQFDDFHHLAENPAIMRLSNLPRFFTDPGTFTNIPGAIGLYRPLLLATHALTFAAAGADPFWFHVVNLGLHLFNTALVFSLLRRWSGNLIAAALAAIFFGLGAAQQESVAYISARSSLLAGAFMLSALRASEGKPATVKAVAAGIFTALALFSKEIAVTLPALLYLRDFFLGGLESGPRRQWRVYACSAAGLALYLAVRLSMVSAFPETYTSRYLYLAGQGRVIWWYLLKTLYPVNLTIFPGIPVVGSWAVNILSWAGLIGLAAVAFLLRRRLPLAAFGALFWLIGFLPTSSVFPLLMTSSLERLYLPLAGLLAVALDLYRRTLQGTSLRRPAAAAAIVILACNFLVTVKLHRRWQSPPALWRHTLAMAPTVSTPWTWLGQAEMDAKRFPQAKKFLLRALQLNPNDQSAYKALTQLYQATGSEVSAAGAWQAALDNPRALPGERLDALLGLAGLDLKDGRYGEAQARAESVLAQYPENGAAHLIVGVVAARRGDDRAAETRLERALELDPGLPGAMVELGFIAYRRQDLERARGLFLKAREGGSDSPDLLGGLGMVALGQGKAAEAKQWFHRALTLDPNHYLALFGFALASAADGDLPGAEKYALRALARNPDAIEAHDLLAKIYLDRAREAAAPERLRLLDLSAEQIKWLNERGLGQERKREWSQLAGK